MRKMRLLCATIGLIWGSQMSLQAQEQGLFFMSNLWQSHRINPAFATATRQVVVGLPHISYQLNSPDTRFGTWVQNRVLQLDSTQTGALPDNNRLAGQVQMGLLELAIPYKNWVFGVSVDQNLTADAQMPGALIHLLAAGNARFLGQNTSFGTSANASIYTSVAANIAYKYGENWDFGAKIKYLSGVKGFFTERDQLKMAFSSQDYAITFDTDFEYKSFGINSTNDVFGGLQPRFSGQNTGFALDLGLRYRTELWTVSASVLNALGQISWKKDGTAHASKGVYTYQGQNADDFNTLFSADSLTQERVQDTLKAIVRLSETSGAVFQQKLPLQMVVGGTYQLSEAWQLGAVVRLQTAPTAPKIALSLNGAYSLSDQWQIGAHYTIAGTDADNVGLYGHFKYKFIQIYALTDNLLGLGQPYKRGLANARLGLNLCF